MPRHCSHQFPVPGVSIYPMLALVPVGETKPSIESVEIVLPPPVLRSAHAFKEFLRCRSHLSPLRGLKRHGGLHVAVNEHHEFVGTWVL
jgi:hypothetical protein